MALGPTEAAGARPLSAIEPVRVVAPSGDASDESADRLNRLEVGQQFPAKILARLKDGSFLVRIADANARVALPGGGDVGDSLLLTLLNSTPRPTFSLDAQSRPGAGTASAALSNAGRLIADIQAGMKPGEAATNLIGKVPLVAIASADAPQLASALHDTLTFSGLFYESHVGQWADGKRPLADLLREPQGKASSAASSAASTAAGATIPNTDDGSAGSAAKPGSTMLDAANLSPEVMQTRRNLLEYFSSAPLPVTSADALDPGLAQLVGMQLNVLEQQRFQWQGELWPGQPMTWEVSRDEQSSSRNTDDPDRTHWQSVVSFTLPNLGLVNATIDLTGNQVQVNLRTDSDATATTLRRHGGGLASALDAAGSVLDGLIVRGDVSDKNDKGNVP